MEKQNITIARFDGGITDNYIDCPSNKAKKMDNLHVEKDGSLKSRQGSTSYHATAYRVDSNRVGTLFNYNNDTALLAHAAKDIYYINGSNVWAKLQGPAAGSAFASNSTANILSHAQWLGHLYLTTDAKTSPMKVYSNSGTYYLRNAGLPAVSSTGVKTSGTLWECITLANDAKAKINAHILDATYHISVPSGVTLDSLTVIADNATDEASLYILLKDISSKWLYHTYDAELAAAWVLHVGQDADADTTGSFVTETLTAASIYLNALKTDFNNHDSDDPSHNGTVSLHQITAASTAIYGSNNYIYGFVYEYSYSVNGITYIDQGPVTYIESKGIYEPGAGYVNTISGLSWPSPVENIDVTNLKITIYRTLNNGSVLYKVGQVSNPTTSFFDLYTDKTISANEQLYTTGGVLDNTAPPKAKYVHIVNNVALWGNITDGSTAYPNRARQSVENDPDSAPDSLNSDFDEELTGVSSANGRHIILCKNKIYRRDGYYDELGNGAVSHEVISDVAGCISNASCVPTQYGLFWAGNNGFYYTNGFQVQKISLGLETTYASLISTTTKKSRIQGCYDRIKNVILWTVQLEESSQDNDAMLELHLDHGISESMCFTVWKNSTSFSPTAISYYNNQLIRAGGLTDGTAAGYLFKHDDSYKSDLKVSASVTDPANWVKKTIIYDYLSPCSSLGIVDARKYVTKFGITCRNQGYVSIQIKSINDDYSAGIKSLAPIRFRGSGLLKEWRRFPAGGMRCSYKQIEITNALTYVCTSSDTGYTTGTVAGTTTKTLTIGTGTFPTDSIDYYLSFEVDSYTTQFLVTVRSTDTLTFADPTQIVTAGSSKKWQLKGYIKDEVIHVQNYNIIFGIVSGDTQGNYGGTSGGIES